MLLVGTSEIARVLSLSSPGQWWAGQRSVTWVNGSNTRYLIDWSRLEDVLAARRLCEGLSCPTRSWSVGGITRHLLGWLGPSPPCLASSERYLADVPAAYLSVRPGTYSAHRYLDLRAAYWQALCRLPSPVVTWTQDGPCWHPLGREAKGRWHAILEGVAGMKPLRVSLNGCMLGSTTPAVVWHRGERVRVPPRAGRYRTAGLAVVRATYEITHLQSEGAGAVFANTDCVIIPEETRPAVWDALGYQWREEARGTTEVYNPGSYRVGSKRTYYYDIGSRLATYNVNTPPPRSYTYRAWH